MRPTEANTRLSWGQRRLTLGQHRGLFPPTFGRRLADRRKPLNSHDGWWSKATPPTYDIVKLDHSLSRDNKNRGSFLPGGER